MSARIRATARRRAIRVTRVLLRATLAAACLAASTLADAGTSSAASCAATKMKATAKRGRDLLACHARAIARGAAVDLACTDRAKGKFTDAFADAEVRSGCAHPGDAPALAALSDGFVGSALAAIPGTGEGARCRSAVLAAIARHLTRLLGAEASFKRQPAKPFRLVEARPAAAAGLELAVARARCATPPDAHTLIALVEGHTLQASTPLLCGDALRDPAEQCDAGDDGGCPAACASDCHCPADPAAFACLDRPGPVITLTGPQPNHYEDLALAPATKLDARTATFSSDEDNRYPLNLAGGDGVCVAGGVVQGTYDRALGWEAMHDLNNAGMRAENARVTFDGPRIDDVTDGLRPVGGPFTVRQAWLSYVRDDCIENDHLQGGLMIDSLLDGCYVALSERPSDEIVRQRFDGRRNVLAVHRSLLRLEPMPDPRGGNPGDVGHGQFFKWDDRGSALALHDNVFLAEQVGQGGADTMGVPDALVSCANNVMVWLGPGPYPAPLPPCFTITTDRSVWDTAVAQWKSRHPEIGSGG